MEGRKTPQFIFSGMKNVFVVSGHLAQAFLSQIFAKYISASDLSQGPSLFHLYVKRGSLRSKSVQSHNPCCVCFNSELEIANRF